MPKFRICVIKTEKYFDHIEVSAENDLEAMRLAKQEALKGDLGLTGKTYWVRDGKPTYDAEVVK